GYHYTLPLERRLKIQELIDTVNDGDDENIGEINLHNSWAEARRLAIERTNAYQQRYITAEANTLRPTDDWEIGDCVCELNEVKPVGRFAKFMPKWTKPQVIINKLGPTTFILKNPYK